jgi:hypothetical protein
MSKYVKVFLLGIISILVIGTLMILFLSNQPTLKHLQKEDTFEYKIIELDSCEYIMYHSVYNTLDDKVVHKGNCKYCQARLIKTFKIILNESNK